MNLQKTWLLSAAMLLFIAVTPRFINAQKTLAEDPVSFISRFYEGYLNGQVFNSVDKQKAYLSKTPFFSKSFKDLMAKNLELCELSRGDDICGFGADGDIYLDAQEFDPHLNFKKSGFKASLSAPDTVDATFTVWPGEHDYYQRKMRFKMVKEEGGWRVDDFGSIADKSSSIFARQTITEENTFLTAQARDLQETWNWVQLYITSADKSYNERASRFFSFPMEICDENGKCGSILRKDKQVGKIITRLHDHPFMAEKDDEFGKKESVDPKEGDQAEKGALEFRFKQSAWWIVKVDFSRQRAAAPSGLTPLQK